MIMDYLIICLLILVMAQTNYYNILLFKYIFFKPTPGGDIHM